MAALDAFIATTVGLMHAVQDRGAEVWVTEARLLEALNGRARALASRIELAPSSRLGGHRWKVAEPWYTASAARHVWLDDMAAVFIRTEPPINETHTTATLILGLIDSTRTAMINNPTGLRLCSEHLSRCDSPPTIVTADPWTVRASVAEQRVVRRAR